MRLTCFPSDSSFTSDRLMGDPSSAQLPVMIAKVSIHTSTRSLTLPSVDIFKYYLSSQYDVSPNKTSSEMLSESEAGATSHDVHVAARPFAAETSVIASHPCPKQGLFSFLFHSIRLEFRRVQNISCIGSALHQLSRRSQSRPYL